MKGADDDRSGADRLGDEAVAEILERPKVCRSIVERGAADERANGDNKPERNRRERRQREARRRADAKRATRAVRKPHRRPFAIARFRLAAAFECACKCKAKGARARVSNELADASQVARRA